MSYVKDPQMNMYSSADTENVLWQGTHIYVVKMFQCTSFSNILF